MAAGRVCRRVIYRNFDRRAVALHHIPDVASGAQPPVRDGGLSLLRSDRMARAASRLCPGRGFGWRVLASYGIGIPVGGPEHVDWNLLGQLAEEGEAVAFLKSRTRVFCGVREPYHYESGWGSRFCSSQFGRE